MRKTMLVLMTVVVCLSLTIAGYAQGKGQGKGGGGGGGNKGGEASEIPVTVTFLDPSFDNRIRGDGEGLLECNPSTGLDHMNSYVDGCQHVDARLQFGNDPFPGSLDLFTNESFLGGRKVSGLRWLVLEFADCDTTRFPDPKPSECGNPFFPQNTGKAEAEFQVLVLDDTGNRFEGHLLAMPLNDPMRAAVEVNLFLDELWSVWFDVISSRERCGEGNSDSATIVRTDPDRWEIQATSEQIACLTHNTKLDGRKPAIVVEGYYPLPFNVVVACNNAQQCEDLTPAAN